MWRPDGTIDDVYNMALKQNKKIRGAYCFICGVIADKENQDGNRFGRFVTTDKRLLEWKKAISKPGLKIGSPICGRHFDVDDIVKGREIGGIFHPFKVWKLKDLAVPKYCTSASANKRNPFAECNNEKQQGKLSTVGKSFSDTCNRSDSVAADTGCFQMHRQQTYHAKQHQSDPVNQLKLCEPEVPVDNVIPNETTAVVVNNVCAMEFTLPSSSAMTDYIATDVGDCITSRQQTVNVSQPQSMSGETSILHEQELPLQNEQTTSFDFHSLTRIVKLPDNWRWDAVNKSCYTTITSGNDFVHKIVLITSDHLDFFINGRKVTFPFLINSGTWQAFDLQRAIHEFHGKYPCCGILDLSLYTTTRTFSVSEFRSSECRSVSNTEDKQCSKCRVHEGKLKSLKVVQSEKVTTLTKRLKAKQRQFQRYNYYAKNAALTVNNLRRSINALTQNQLSEKIRCLPQQVVYFV